MTEVLHSPSSSPSPSISTPTHNSTLFNQSNEGLTEEEEEVRENERREQLSLLALLVALFRKSFWAACKSDGAGGGMDISWPRDVEHLNHVTFDRFDGFLGLPVEFEPDLPTRPPSASATVFGVSTESMQMSYDSRGNSIPTILLLMQRHLYSQGGLQVEGIFRITAGNSQEEFVRDQLNRGVVPRGIDVHCLAGLIKAWFRELPKGLLDSVSAEQVMQCQSEEDCDALVRLLPQTEAALLDWAINLMADVVQHERFNKMNTRNIAMVFAPNMTQMADPLTALMHAVQVMNFLKTLIEKNLREREDSVTESTSILQMEPSNDNGNQSCSSMHNQDLADAEDPVSDTDWETSQVDNITDEDYHSYSTCTEESEGSRSCETPKCIQNPFEQKLRTDTDQSSGRSELKIDGRKDRGLHTKIDENKKRGTSNLSRLNSMAEWFEAWR